MDIHERHSMRKGRMAALLGAGVLALSLSIGLASTAHASDPTVPSETWNEIFVPFDNGLGNTLCVDVPGGTTAPGAQLQLYHCHGYASDGAPQRFSWDCDFGISCALGGEDFKMFNVSSQLCIGVPSGNAVNGARLIQESCRDITDVGWTMVKQNTNGTDPLFVLESDANRGLCMAAGNLLDGNRTPLVVANCNGFSDSAQILELG